MVSNERKPLVDLLTPDMVDIYVGSKRKQYHLHKPLLCHQSEFFKKAFSGDFKESEERALYLPDDDPTAFELFIHWLYTGRLDEPWGPGGRRPYIKLYILASKLCMESLANAAIDRLQVFYATAQRYPDVDMIVTIWSDTLPSSKLRQFCAKKVAIALLTRSSFNPWKIYLDSKTEALTDIMLHVHEAWQTKQLPSIPVEPDCTYHEHTTTEKCKDRTLWRPLL